jgi:hypothetical protein
MTAEPLKDLKAELESLRARLEQLRVQANLGGKELRDRLKELEAVVEPAYAKAKKRLSESVRTGAAEAKILARSLLAGWEELVAKHRELSQQAERKRTGKT